MLIQCSQKSCTSKSVHNDEANYVLRHSHYQEEDITYTLYTCTEAVVILYTRGLRPIRGQVMCGEEIKSKKNSTVGSTSESLVIA